MWQKIAVYTVMIIKLALIPALLFLAYKFGRMVESEGIAPVEALKSLPARVVGSSSDSPQSTTTTTSAPASSNSTNGASTEVYSYSGSNGASNSHYTVSVGSFNNREEARNLRQQLMSHRINNSVLELNNKYHVVVGKFSSSGKAGKTLNKVHQKGFSEAKIIAH
mgnify:FL=1